MGMKTSVKDQIESSPKSLSLFHSNESSRRSRTSASSSYIQRDVLHNNSDCCKKVALCSENTLKLLLSIDYKQHNCMFFKSMLECVAQEKYNNVIL